VSDLYSAKVSVENQGTYKRESRICKEHFTINKLHSSRIRFLRFFQNPKTPLFTFFKVSCQKTLKKRRKRYPSLVFTLLHCEMLTGTFAVKTIHACHVIRTTLH